MVHLRLLFIHLHHTLDAHWICHTLTPYAWVYGQFIFWVEVLTVLSCKLHLGPFHLQTSPQLFLLRHQKDSLVFFFKLSPALGMICCRKEVHLTRQHPSLGSIIAELIDAFEVLISMPKFGQELPVYIFLSLVKTIDFMHPNWEGFIIIHSFLWFLARTFGIAPVKDHLKCVSFMISVVPMKDNLKCPFMWLSPDSEM